MKTLITIIALPLVLFLGFGQEVEEAYNDLTTTSSSKPGPFELGSGQSVPDALQGQAFRYE